MSIILWFTTKSSGTREYFLYYYFQICQIQRCKAADLNLCGPPLVRSSHHMSLDQGSPPQGGASPTCHYALPSLLESKDDFPLRKTGRSAPVLHTHARTHSHTQRCKFAERARKSPAGRNFPFSALGFFNAASVCLTHFNPRGQRGHKFFLRLPTAL